MVANATGTEDDPLGDDWSCMREDNRNLIEDWINIKTQAGLRHKFVRTKSEMDQVSSNDVDYLMGRSVIIIILFKTMYFLQRQFYMKDEY